MNNLLKRTIAGIIFVFIMVEGTLWTTWSFYGLWALVGILCLFEFYGLARGEKAFNQRKGLTYALGTTYILIPIGLIMTMDPRMVVTFLTVVWMNDVGAFIVGSTIGKHRLAPKISPKKSWEGFFGGLVFAMGTSLIWHSLFWSDTNRSLMPLFQDEATHKILWLIFGLVIGLAAVVGDLMESKFKRIVGVKDSGRLIPGHGGMLDRFDATLLAAPIAWLFYTFILFQ